MPVSDAEYAHNCLFVKQNKESKKLQIRLRPWLQILYCALLLLSSFILKWAQIAVKAA